MNTLLHQEILLITGTSFSLRQCLQKNDSDSQEYVAEAEQLQEACWNGQLGEMLPEIYKSFDGDTMLYLWEIKQNKSGIEIILGEAPDEMEKGFSIDPYSFLSAQAVN